MHLSIFVKQLNQPEHRLHNHILINEPIGAPDRKRTAIWLHLNEVFIVWTREFLEEHEALQ